MKPWESCPAKLASAKWCATVFACSSVAPAARSTPLDILSMVSSVVTGIGCSPLLVFGSHSSSSGLPSIRMIESLGYQPSTDPPHVSKLFHR